MNQTPLRAVPAALVVVLGSLLASCGGGGGEPPAITQPPIQASTDARYQIVLTDSVTGARITDALKVTFTGDASLKASDGTSLNGKTVTTEIGVVSLNAAFTATAKAFNVQVADGSGKGWIATGTMVVGEAGLKGDQTVELKMVGVQKAAAINSSPEPVAMAVKTATAAADGTLTAPVSVVTAPKTIVNAEGQTQTIGVASVALSTGTKGTAADGTTAAPGALTVSSTYYSNASPSSMTAFPGGFAATVEVPAQSAAVLNGNTPTSGVFITGGFAQFNVTDSAGKAIKNFDKPVTVGIDLPKGSKDPSGKVLVVGDQYPVWSYNDTSGKWVFEKMGTVAEKSPVDAANFTVNFETTHLSSWNLDYYQASCTAQVNLTGRPAGDARSLYVQLVGTTGNRWTGAAYDVRDSEITFYRAPADIRVNVEVLDGDQKVGQLNNVALCSGALSVPVTLGVRVVGGIRVETSESCANGSGKRGVPTYVGLWQRSNWSGEYSTVATGATVGTTTFSSLGLGAAQIYVQNPRNGNWEVRDVTVAANTTSQVAVNFTVPCATGATGGSSTN